MLKQENKLYNAGTENDHINMYPVSYESAKEMVGTSGNTVNELTDVEYACWNLYTNYGWKNNDQVRNELKELLKSDEITPQKAAGIMADRLG